MIERMRKRTVQIVLAIAAPVLLGCNQGVTDPEPEDFAVLFVGNSLTYTHDLPRMLEKLFEMGGAGDIVVRDISGPNYGLIDHWSFGAREVIAEGDWDVVVMQQGPSATEGRPSLLQYSEMFAEEIRAVGGEPAIYMVWPAEVRSFDMNGVSTSHRAAAELIDGMLFPALEAWRKVWEVAPSVDFYGPDRFHPSLAGTYMAALVMYQQLAEADPRGLPAVIPGPNGDVQIDEELADILQTAAFEANAEFAR